MSKGKKDNTELLKLIAQARDYFIDVLACGVSAGLPGISPESIQARRDALAAKEAELVLQAEKVSGD